jgi:hypothetical protein
MFEVDKSKQFILNIQIKNIFQIFQVTVSKVWAFLAAIFIIIAPFVNEIYDIYKAFLLNRRVFPFGLGRRNTKIKVPASQNNIVNNETNAADVEEPNEMNTVDIDNEAVETVRRTGVEIFSI